LVKTLAEQSSDEIAEELGVSGVTTLQIVEMAV
jgi:hypothetical protein